VLRLVVVPFTLDQACFSFKTSCNINHCRYCVELFRTKIPPAIACGEGASLYLRFSPSQ